MKPRQRRIWIAVISVFFTLFVILPLAAIGIIKWFVLPPEKLTPIVLHYVKPLVNGQVEIDRIELKFWNTFPKIGLELTGGQVISYACKDSLSLATGQTALSDTLLSFSRASVTVDALDYVRKNRVTVERLVLEDPFFYGLIDEEGRMNWNVTWPSEDDEAEDGEGSPVPFIDLQRLGVRNGHFIYEDRPGGLYAETAGFNLRMRNKLRRGNLNIDIKTGFESLIFDSPAYTLENDLSLRFESKVDFYRGRVEFADAKLLLNDLPFSTDGSVEKVDDNLMLDIVFGMKVENLAELLGFVPDEYFRNRKKITTRGSLSLEGRIDGLLGDNSSPDIRLLALLDKGALKTKGSAHGIERLDAEVGLYLNGNHPDSSVINFRKLDMEGTNTSFTATARISQALTNPYVDATVRGRIDFEGMLQDIINPDSFTVKGALDADIEAQFRLWELTDGDLSRLNAAGRFNVDRMFLADRASGMSLYAGGLRFEADTTRQQSRFLTDDDLISARLTVDTVSIRYGREINTRLGRLDMQAKTSRSFDTTSVVPVTTNIRVANLRARLPDSVWVAARDIIVAGGIKASDSDRKKGVFAGAIKVDTLKYFDVPGRTRLLMQGSTFNVQMMPLRDAMRRQRVMAAGSAAGDSTTRPVREPGALRNRPAAGRLPEDARTGGGGRGESPAGGGPAPGDVAGSSTAVAAAGGNTSSPLATGAQPPPRQGAGRGQAAGSAAAGSGRTETGIVRNWEIKGNVKFETMRMATGMFPLPISMTQTTLAFDTDKINLSNARMKVGRSDLLLNGEINNIRRAILRGEVIKGNLSLVSDYVDCNQLMRAINRSVLMAEEGTVDSVADEEAVVEAWEAEGISGEDELDEGGLFLVPANLDLVLRANVRKVDFEDVVMENIDGEIIVRNQSVNLRRLKMDSNVGSGNVTMVYTAREREKATAAFELELENIIVERLIDMFPSIDSLVPMLRSFEGVLDCQMTAMCELDSMMNVVLPSLNTACYLSGENMVLMDGETFAEISKKLMFKNKERNQIDYISVDLHINDNKVEVFPFLVELDRYKLAVGGVHNLDMTFDYHVSVLKSPVPFKLGIDITGDLDNFKFRIVKCKYKQLFKAAREEELQDTRMNLRASIRESIAASLRANAPELGSGYTQERIRSRRPETAVTDMDEDDDADPEAFEEEGYVSEITETAEPAAGESVGEGGSPARSRRGADGADTPRGDNPGEGEPEAGITGSGTPEPDAGVSETTATRLPDGDADGFPGRNSAPESSDSAGTES